VQHLEVADAFPVHFLEIVQELQDESQQVVQVIFFLLFFLALVDSSGAGDVVFLTFNFRSLLFPFVPLDYFAYPENG
jgi:hypothetical protein